MDKELEKRINLIRLNPSFVFRETGDLGEADVLQLDEIPDQDGTYFVGGVTVLRCGLELKSVFEVDTASGGSLLAAYWWHGDRWLSSQDTDVASILALRKPDIFPFDWRFNQRLVRDIFHD